MYSFQTMLIIEVPLCGICYRPDYVETGRTLPSFKTTLKLFIMTFCDLPLYNFTDLTLIYMYDIIIHLLIYLFIMCKHNFLRFIFMFFKSESVFIMFRYSFYLPFTGHNVKGLNRPYLYLYFCFYFVSSNSISVCNYRATL